MSVVFVWYFWFMILVSFEEVEVGGLLYSKIIFIILKNLF